MISFSASLVREIPDFPDYRINTSGRIWSRRTRWGNSEWREISGFIVDEGYIRIGLLNEKCKVLKYVHRLVLETFVGPCPLGMQACHANGIRTDNRLVNLRWDTRIANMADRLKHGKTAQGERNWNARLSDRIVLEMRERHKNGESAKVLSIDYKITINHVYSIVNGKTWRHLLQGAPPKLSKRCTMTKRYAAALALAVGGEAYYTSGNLWVVLIGLADGRFSVIGAKGASVYASRAAYEADAPGDAGEWLAFG